MLWGIKHFLSQFLSENGFQWSKGVDLGSGWGEAGPILKNHVDYLIGVDINEDWVKQAILRGYDELILADAKEYDLQNDVQVAFLFDVIEHLPWQCGEKLLDKINWVPNILITTPAKYYKEAGKGLTHVSLWSEEDFQIRGYYTTVFMAGGFLNFFPQPIIFAFK